MAHINRSALLPFSTEQMYRLVNDVAQYPQYLDGCIKAEVHEQSDVHMRATLELARGGISLVFTTANQLDAPKSIVMNLQNGPFTQFEGRWFFQTLSEDACKVILDLQFELASRVSGLAAKKLFDSVSNNMVDAMVKRAKQIYG